MMWNNALRDYTFLLLSLWRLYGACPCRVRTRRCDRSMSILFLTPHTERTPIPLAHHFHILLFSRHANAPSSNTFRLRYHTQRHTATTRDGISAPVYFSQILFTPFFSSFFVVVVLLYIFSGYIFSWLRLQNKAHISVFFL